MICCHVRHGFIHICLLGINCFPRFNSGKCVQLHYSYSIWRFSSSFWLSHLWISSDADIYFRWRRLRVRLCHAILPLLPLASPSCFLLWYYFLFSSEVKNATRFSNVCWLSGLAHYACRKLSYSSESVSSNFTIMNDASDLTFNCCMRNMNPSNFAICATISSDKSMQKPKYSACTTCLRSLFCLLLKNSM